MSYPMSETESMHDNVLSHLSIAVAKLMYEMNLEETEYRYDQEYFINLDPDKNVVLTIELLVVPKGEWKDNNMSTEWRFVDDVLPPPDELVFVTDGEIRELARRTEYGTWVIEHLKEHKLTANQIVAWFRIPRVPEPYGYEEWKLKRYGHL